MTDAYGSSNAPEPAAIDNARIDLARALIVDAESDLEGRVRISTLCQPLDQKVHAIAGLVLCGFWK
jgi:hypothetical protein